MRESLTSNYLITYCRSKILRLPFFEFKNKTMEQILAFVLGVGAVAFIWVVVVAFKTVGKVKELEKCVTDMEIVINRNEEMVNRRVDQEIDRVDSLIHGVYSYTDSRVDKLEAKTTKDKQVIKG